MKVRRLVKYTSCESILKLGDWLNEDVELYKFLKKNEHENIYISFIIDEHFSKAMWKRRSEALQTIPTSLNKGNDNNA